MVESSLANNTVNDSDEIAGRGVASPSFGLVAGAIAAGSGLSCSSAIGFTSLGGDGTSGSVLSTLGGGWNSSDFSSIAAVLVSSSGNSSLEGFAGGVWISREGAFGIVGVISTGFR